MGRELKFRIWDAKNNEWLGESDPDTLTWKDFNLFGECMALQKIPIERYNDLVVEQYTGLKDENGKEIYEGDIMQTTDGIVRYVVEWDDDGLCYYGKSLTDAPDFTMSIIEKNDEVVGNIHGKNCWRKEKKLNEDWEDAPEEPKEYWYIDGLNVSGVEKRYWEDSPKQRFDKEIGNYFGAKEEAKKAVEKLKAWQRLRDKGFRFVEHQTHGTTGDGIMDGVVYYEDAKNVDKADLDLLFGSGE